MKKSQGFFVKKDNHKIEDFFLLIVVFYCLLYFNMLSILNYIHSIFPKKNYIHSIKVQISYPTK